MNHLQQKDVSPPAALPSSHQNALSRALKLKLQTASWSVGRPSTHHTPSTCYQTRYVLPYIYKMANDEADRDIDDCFLVPCSLCKGLVSFTNPPLFFEVGQAPHVYSWNEVGEERGTLIKVDRHWCLHTANSLITKNAKKYQSWQRRKTKSHDWMCTCQGPRVAFTPCGDCASCAKFSWIKSKFEQQFLCLCPLSAWFTRITTFASLTSCMFWRHQK